MRICSYSTIGRKYELNLVVEVRNLYSSHGRQFNDVRFKDAKM